MANNRTITSANAVLMLSVVGLYDSPRQIQGWSSDNFTDMGDMTQSETSRGLDGRLSAGFIFGDIVQNITLMADSESNDFFENWGNAERQRRELYIANGSILLRAIDRRYTMTRGFLRAMPPMPTVGRTLQARRYSITWEKVTPAPV
jgi:hypothetical protein